MAKTKKIQQLSKKALFSILSSSFSMLNEMFSQRSSIACFPLYREHSYLMNRLYFSSSKESIFILQPLIISFYNEINDLYLKI